MVPPPDALGKISDALTNANQEGGSLTSLWRPLTMTQIDAGRPSAAVAPPTSQTNITDSPATVRMAGSRLATASPASTAATETASPFGALMLQPFRLKNVPAIGASRGTGSESAAAAAVPNMDLGDTIRSSALVHQLSMSQNGAPNASEEAPSESATRTPRISPEQLTTGSIDPVALAAVANGTASQAELVAFLQELAPEPADLDIELGAEREALQNEEKEAQDGEDSEKSLAGAEKLGTEPEDNTLQFLRTETVLLKPGKSQCDVGIQYLFTENDFPILITDSLGNVVAVDEINFRARELSVPLEYRVGLLDKLQGFIGASVGWANTQLALDAFDVFDNDGGLGDVYFGLTMQLAAASADCPYVIGTVSAIAPTGNDPFIGAIGFAPSAPSLGQGFWSISGNLLCIQPYDPVVIFYGLGIKYLFERDFLGAEFEPGMQYEYQMGVGFAVNERITLSTRFFGSYIEEFRVNDIRRFGTNSEPMSIRMSATISKPKNRFVEPFVEFGVTDDAVSSFFGIQYTH
jgi:hypothetical protein